MMKQVLLIFSLLTLTAAAAAERPFTLRDLSVIGCNFDEVRVHEYLRHGFENLDKVNPELAANIKAATQNRPLKIYCDVLSASAPIYYSPDEQAIHIRKTNDGRGSTGSNIWHEFLHFGGLEHITLPDEPTAEMVFTKDPTYACHLTGFPDLAERIPVTAEVLTQARELCASVKL